MERFLIDAHCDTITRLMNQKKELFKNDCHIDIEKLKSYDNVVQFFAVWFDTKNHKNLLEKTLKYIDFYNEQLKKYNQYIAKVETSFDIKSNKNSKKISAVLAIEGGEVLEGKISALKTLYDCGVRAITLTWNYDNEISGAIGNNKTGLTPFGEEVVLNMNLLGMIIDVSHLSYKGFWDVDRITKKPFMASHSNVKNLCNHKRNLDDKQIRAIANKGGVIGINMFSEFLLEDKQSTIDDVMEHIKYIINLAGTDCIGFGCDFDGIDKTPISIDDISKLNIVIDNIVKVYGETVTEKILNRNFMRLIKEIF